ncbi:MAG: hypothetical protein KDB36_09595 [Acidimicrobiales bacterium]|nr:hypothetical protein [Acidimicrobiales bacterium]
MTSLDAATFLLQWATGGLAFLWVTTRRREVGLGYGWLMRSTYGLMALGALYVGLVVIDTVPVREAASAVVVLASGVALAVSIVRRGAGVAGQTALADARSERVAAMTGIDRAPAAKDATAKEFPPVLDVVAPIVGMVGVVAAAVAAGDQVPLTVARFVVGALFLGAVTDAMLLGHWYLVQPGLPRAPLLELVRWSTNLTIPEIALLLVPTGMVSVFVGDIDDSYGGMLGWFWAACAVTTLGLLITTRLALRERQYSAVMAATGLLYLAILTAFGTDLVARALLRS